MSSIETRRPVGRDRLVPNVAELPRLALPVLFVVFLVVFSVLRPNLFPVWSNATTILQAQSIGAMIALGALLPLIAGEIDASVGATLGLSTVFCAWAFGHGWPVEVVVVAALAIGVTVGAFNSALVVGLGINSFIATLATTTLLQGLNVLVTGGQTLFSGIPTGVLAVSRNDLAGVPLVAVYALALAALVWYATQQTPYGRRLLATGSARAAARLIGVRTRAHAASAFVAAGAIGGLCGFLQLAKTGSASAGAGQEFLLPAFAAVFLGATASRTGRVNVWGTLVAVLTLAVGITGLTQLGAPIWVPDVFNGSALVVALVASRLSPTSRDARPPGPAL